MTNDEAEPLVSIVVSTFNVERFLGEALESVRAQSYRNWELVVVDDGSTDRTLEVARCFAPARVIALRENGGDGDAKNLGVRSSSGRILCFLDGDDRWVPGKLEVQVRHLLDREDVGFVLGQQQYFFDGDASLPSFIPQALQTEPHTAYCPSVLAVWRRVFDQVGHFDHRYSRQASDSDWFFRAQDAGVRHFDVPQLLLWRRVHASNVSFLQLSTARARRLEIIKASIDRKRQANAGRS